MEPQWGRRAVTALSPPAPWSGAMRGEKNCLKVRLKVSGGEGLEGMGYDGDESVQSAVDSWGQGRTQGRGM